MERLVAKWGVKRSLIVLFSAVLLVSMAWSGWLLARTVRQGFMAQSGDRARAAARIVAAGSVGAMKHVPGAVSVEAEVDEGWSENGADYVVVLDANRAVVASHSSQRLNEQVKDVIERHAGRGLKEDVFESGDRVAATVPIDDGTGRVLGWVLLGLDASRMSGQVNAILWKVLLYVLLPLFVILIAAVWLLVTRFVLRPITAMSGVAQLVSDCDLTARAPKPSEDELGVLAESLNRIGENLAATLARVQNVTGGVGTVIERISKTGASVSSGVGTVSARVLDTSASMGDMISSLKGIADNVEVLAQSAEESSSSILQMAATNDEVAENIQALAASVEETTAAIEEMTYSIKEVAKNIEELSATTEETSSSMNEMDVSISQVESNANETAKLSEQAQRDAEMGTEALSRTLAGIDKIKGSSRDAATVIEELGKKIAAIGNILNVIDDVAEQTNLLALNAAILAAQSGEHGKGFAVVADEIKDLAERTGASTKEIADLIRAVQDSSKQAIASMDRGVRNVEEGVRLGQEAESALKKIQESSQKSTQMVKAIARATIEQARGSKQVTVAINRIAETVQQIATATAEQARGSEQIMKSAEKMKAITKHVERSAQEQSRGSKQITRAIESISEMVHHLNRAQKEQTKGSEQVMTAVVQIKQVAEAQTSSVRDLEAAIGDLASQAEVLRGEVRRFKI
jgi:methyl-accepting chemotaxis protein